MGGGEHMQNVIQCTKLRLGGQSSVFGSAANAINPIAVHCTETLAFNVDGRHIQGGHATYLAPS